MGEGKRGIEYIIWQGTKKMFTKSNKNECSCRKIASGRFEPIS
jgi:hypothetical protein